MKKLLIKKSIFAGSYILLALLIEIITFVTMGIGVLPEHIGLDLAVILIFAFIIFVIPNSVAELVVEGLLLAVQMVVSVANEALYATSETVFSLSMLNLMKEFKGVMTASFINWGLVGGFIALFAAAVAGLIFMTVKYRTNGVTIKKERIAVMLAAFLVAECTCGLAYALVVNSLSASAEGDEDYSELSVFVDEETLYSDQLFPAKAFIKFGTFGYLVSNIGNAITQSAVSDGITEEDLDEYFAEGELSPATQYGDNIYTGSVEGKNVVLIVIESGEWYAINQDYTPTLYAMATQGIAMTGFYGRNKTNISEAISIMGSYPSSTQYEPPKVVGNVSALSYAMPSLVGEYGYTTNYFHVNTREYYSREEVFDNLYGFDNTYFLEDMDMLKGNYSKDGFYDFDKDSDIFRSYLDEFTTGTPFYTQMMSIITHGSYEDLIDYGNYPFATTPSKAGEKSTGTMTEEEMAEFSENCTVKGLEDYYRLIDSFPTTYVEGTVAIDEEYLEETGKYSEMFLRYKRYQAGMMDLDLGVNMLVNHLIESEEIEDTMFVFYADHSAYYNQMNYALKGIDTSQSYNTDIYNIPFFIWYGGSMNLNAEDPGIAEYKTISYTATGGGALKGGTQIDKFCSAFDVMPTILDLLGYSYNTNLYYGASVFSDERRVFVSYEAGIFTDDIYFSTINLYIRKKGEWEQYDFDELYESGNFDENQLNFLYEAVRYYTFQKMLEAVIALDYFSEVNIFEGKSYNGGQITYIQSPNSQD